MSARKDGIEFRRIVTPKTMAPQIFFEVLQKKKHPLAQDKDFYAINVGFQHSKFYSFDS